MNDVKTVRRINETEREIICGSIGKISNAALSELTTSSCELIIAESSSRERYFFPMIYLIPKDLFELIHHLKSKIHSAGLYFGFIKKGKFLISLEGAIFLHERNCFTEEQQIQVNEKGEKSILYGNKVLKNMISRLPPNLKKNTFIIIFNSCNELIAIGQAQADNEIIRNLKKNGIIALNLVDRGYYLRKQ